MARTKAIAAIGTLLQASDQPNSATDDPGEHAYTTLAEVRDIAGPECTAEEIDVTNHSTEGNFAEFIAGLLDAGTLAFDMNMIQSDPTQALVLADYLALFRRWYHLVFPIDIDLTPVNDRTIELMCYVQRHAFSAPVRDALTKGMVLRVVGAPAFGIGGAS